MPAKKSPAIHSDLESVLVTKAQISRRVKSLGRELKRIYGDEEITVVAIMNGAILFTADLLREIDNVVRLDCIRTTSYGNATESHGTPKLVHGLTLDVTMNGPASCWISVFSLAILSTTAVRHSVHE